MKKVREVAVVGFAADANPNVTAPADADVYTFTGRAADQQSTEGVEGLEVAIRFVDSAVPPVEIPGATCTWRAWFKDEEQSAAAPAGLGRQAWVAAVQETNASSSQLFALPKRGGKLFIQVLALGTVGTATKAHVLVGESASVAG